MLRRYANMYAYMQQNESRSEVKDPTYFAIEPISEIDRSSKLKALAPIK